MHGGDAVLPFLEDIAGDEVVHIVESPIALEEAVGRVHVLRPILIPKMCHSHSKIARASKAVFRIRVEFTHGVAVKGRCVTLPGFVQVRGVQQCPFEVAASGCNFQEIGGEVLAVFFVGGAHIGCEFTILFRLFQLGIVLAMKAITDYGVNLERTKVNVAAFIVKPHADPRSNGLWNRMGWIKQDPSKAASRDTCQSCAVGCGCFRVVAVVITC